MHKKNEKMTVGNKNISNITNKAKNEVDSICFNISTIPSKSSKLWEIK